MALKGTGKTRGELPLQVHQALTSDSMQKNKQVLECISVMESLPSMLETLDMIPRH